MNDVVSTPLSSAPPDTAALAWVLEQVRDNLLGALAAVRRQAQLSGLEAAQAEATSALLQARTHVHQAAGALELLGQAGTARVLHTAERVLMSALEQPQRLDAPMIEALESALHAALDYLEARANGRDESAVKLFRQYRGLADLAGGEQPHPADLWDLSWSWPQPPDDVGTPRPLGTQARSDYERALLDVLRAGNLRNAGSIMQAVARQARNAAQGDERALWWIAEGFFAGLGDELLDTDIYVKRLCNRLNLQLRQMLSGQSQVSQRLGHELAFFCEQALAQAGALGRQAPPVLRAVGHALGLRPREVIDWQRPHFGLVDPALVQQARKRMVQVKDGWSHIGNGDFSRISRLQENLQQFGVLIRQLCTGAEVLPAAVERLVALVGEQHSKLTPERVLEVATALLFLEASLVHFRADDADFLPRARELAQRLQRSAEGYASEAFAPWMEALYRKVSETQTLGTVVQELRHDMGTVEHVLDAYFRDPRTLAELEPVPRLLGQMRGVLSVLGVDVGAQALGHIRHSVENLMAAPPQPAVARQPGGPFDRLAANIGALGFMVDMLGYQPELAKASFQFDPQKGELRPVVPHARQTAPALPPETRGDEAPAAPAPAEPTAAAPLASPEAAAAEAPAPEAPPIPAPPRSTHAGGVEDLALPSLEEADTLVPQPEPEAPAQADTVPAAQDLEPPSTGGEPDLDALLAPPPAAVAA
ncbi:MAG: histidine kinase, partial [Betaproteobacteria bacterium]|nr:histidine kinase [Betaproteobacteria bacterium]